MKLASCDECGVVIDTDKVDHLTEDNEQGIHKWWADEHLGYPCPVCPECVIFEERKQ